MCIVSAKSENIVGRRYGRLLIIQETQTKILPSGQKQRRYLCKCDCGVVFDASKTTITKNQCCSDCSARSKHLSVFLKRLSETDRYIQYISGFINYKQPIICRCTKCGLTWGTMTPDVILRKSSSSKCPNCGKAERIAIATLTQEEFERRVAIKNPNIVITGKYISARKPINFKCTKCGVEQKVIRAEVLTRKSDFCPVCNKKFRYDTQTFIKKIATINPYVEIIGEYISNSQRIKSRCKICGHIWNPIADQIMQGYGCPECNITGTSFVEQVILWSLREIYGEDAVLHRNRDTIGRELDIYVPSIKLAIEPGGWHWHNKSYQRDMEKYELCKEKGIRCITIYDQAYGHISNQYPENDFWLYCTDLGKNHDKLKSVIYRILTDVVGVKIEFSEDIWNKIFTNAKEQNIKRHDNFIRKFIEKNEKAKTIIIKGLYYRNTDPLECECKVCGYGKNGEWLTTGQSLLQGHGCPCCAGQVVVPGKNDLNTKNPTLSKEWDYEKNTGLTPADVMPGSHKKVWWKCSNGHEWEAQIRARVRGNGCPECAKEKRKKTQQFP